MLLKKKMHINDYFAHLKDIYKMVVAYPPEYTEAHMVRQAITSIEISGLFLTALLKWNGFDPANNNWESLKAHFSETHILLITTCPQVTCPNLAANAQTTQNKSHDEDDDSLTQRYDRKSEFLVLL